MQHWPYSSSYMERLRRYQLSIDWPSASRGLTHPTPSIPSRSSAADASRGMACTGTMLPVTDALELIVRGDAKFPKHMSA